MKASQKKAGKGVTLKARLIIAMACIMVPVAVITLVHAYSISVFTHTLDDLIEESILESQPLQNLLLSVQDSDLEAHDYLAYGTSLEKQEYMEAASAASRAFADALKAPYEEEEERDLVRSAFIKWKFAHNMILAQMHGKEPGIELKQMRAIDSQFKGVEETLAMAIERAHEEMTDVHSGAMKQLHTSITLTAALAACVLVVAFLVGRWSIRSLTGQLVALTGMVKAVGTSEEPDVNTEFSNDEIGRLARAVNDMSERMHEHTKSLESQAEHDELTGLYNHRGFTRILETETERSIRYGRVVGLLLMDLDNFKEINDTYGHPAGDEALTQVAVIVSENIRSVDIAARYGGDEIAVIMPETTSFYAHSMAERLRLIIHSQPIVLPKGERINISVSVGVSEFPAGKVSSNDLISAADEALYKAKRTGRNRVCLEPGLKDKP